MRKRIVRPSKKIVLKRRPKIPEWELLYNRLQDEDDLGVYHDVSAIVGGDPMEDLFDMVEMMLARFDSKIETLQMNHPDHVSWRVYLAWKDKRGKPLHGHIYPTLYTVKTSPHLIRSATLAYLDLCKQAKAWL